MEPKDKELLLKDLCVRTPYGVMIQTDNPFPQKLEGIIFDKGKPYIWVSDGGFALGSMSCKPYLVPLSSMTEEQKRESPFESSLLNAFINGYISLFEDEKLTAGDIVGILDWLNKHHFDYRGLIEKGLAIKAPEGMYN